MFRQDKKEELIEYEPVFLKYHFVALQVTVAGKMLGCMGDMTYTVKE